MLFLIHETFLGKIMKTITSILIKILVVLQASVIFYSVTATAAGHSDKWTLAQNESRVTFSSIKKGTVGEVHSFSDFSGVIDHNKASIDIKTASVDMLVPIRTERALKHLFETDLFPTINITSDVSSALSTLKGADNGSTKFADIPASLSLHGVTKDITLNVAVTQNGNTVTVTSAKPVVVKAADYNMDGGVAKLAELVGGIPIASTVPVNFFLTFKK